MRRGQRRGMTFMEVMFTALITIIVLVAVLQVYASAFNLISRAREITIATDDLKDVLEKMRNVDFASLVATFPHNGAIGAALVGGFLLQNESIVVSYPNGTTVDPLLIQVSLSWTGRDRRNYTQTFRTTRTGGI